MDMINEYNYVTIHLNWIKITCFYFHINDLVLNDHELTMYSFSIKLLCIMSSRHITIKSRGSDFLLPYVELRKKEKFFFFGVLVVAMENEHM